jgi:hypothetical protein
LNRPVTCASCGVSVIADARPGYLRRYCLAFLGAFPAVFGAHWMLTRVAGLSAFTTAWVVLPAFVAAWLALILREIVPPWWRAPPT